MFYSKNIRVVFHRPWLSGRFSVSFNPPVYKLAHWVVLASSDCDFCAVLIDKNRICVEQLIQSYCSFFFLGLLPCEKRCADELML